MSFRSLNTITWFKQKMNILNFIAHYPCRLGATLFALCLSGAVHAGLFGDEDILWQSGQNLYIKLVKQDKSDTGKAMPNQHPASLDPQQVTNALKMAEYWSKKSILSRTNRDDAGLHSFSARNRQHGGRQISSRSWQSRN